MKKKKFRYWLLLIPVLIAAVVFIAVFWDAVLIHIAPKAVLTGALTDVFAQLEERFRDDPVLILLKNIDPDGKYTADIEVTATTSPLGTVDYNIHLQTNGIEHQLYAEGNMVTANTPLTLSWYADAEFTAVASNDLTGGSYYGITYDTFSEDIRSIPLLSFFISSKTLSQWDSSVHSLQEKVKQNWTVPQIPEMSEEDMQKFLLGILAFPCDIEKASISIDDSSLECYAISYSASGEQVDTFLSSTPYGENASVTVIFYLYENKLVKVQFSCASANQSVLYGLELGQNPLENTLYLHRTINDNGTLDGFSLSVDTQRAEDQYLEAWCYCQTQDGVTQNTELEFEYCLSDGAMKLVRNGNSKELNLSLLETDNGFRIQTENLEYVLYLLAGNTIDVDSPISGTVTVTKGCQITTPAYKNLNQWSLDDFWTLLGGIGSLIGIQIDS